MDSLVFPLFPAVSFPVERGGVFGSGANAGVVAPQVLHYRAHPLPPMQGRGMFPGPLGQEGEMEGEEGVGGEEDGVRAVIIGS